VKTLPGAAVLPTYARADVTFVRGDGAWLVGDDGTRYLDLVAGIAVVGLGHLHPAPLVAAQAQLEQLWHVSNLYWTEPMQALAERLSDRFGGASAFFCNSGAEANEAALKYARKATGRSGFVALEGSFHGRTFGALAVTGQPAKRTAFEPMLPGVAFVEPGDVEALDAAVGTDTAAIILEPVLGEGGVHPVPPAFLQAARDMADARGAVLLLDEVQTGVGRTGTFFAWEQAGVQPDALTLAKGLANGLPIGALLVGDEAPEGFVPGDHASTFGGNPVTCAAACAVVDELTEELLANVRERSAQLTAGLNALAAVTQVRGLGLLLAAELDRPAADVIAACLEHGLLVGPASPTAIRITPSLTLTAAEADQALTILEEVLA
jgi:acetylornithine aminotransferase